MRISVILSLLLATTPCFAAPQFVLMVEATSAPPEVQKLSDRSLMLWGKDQFQESIDAQQEAFRLHRQIAGENSPDLIDTLQQMIDPQLAADQGEGAVATCQEML